MNRLCTNYTYVCWIVSGLLFSVAFLAPYTWFLFVPALWIFLILFVQTQSLKNIFWGTWIVGTIKAAGALSWFWSTYPLSLTGFETGVGQVFLIGIFWMLSSVFIGLGFSSVWLFFKVLVKKNSTVVFLLPFIWVLAEVTGSLSFSLYSLGPGSSPNISFSFGYIGYLLSNIEPLFPIAIFGGVYALTFFASTSVFIIFILSKNIPSNKQATVFFLGFFVAYTIGVYAYNPLPTESQNVGMDVLVIDTDFTGEQLVSITGFIKKEIAVVEAVQSALQYETDVILLPEDSRFTRAFPSTREALNFVLKESSGREVVLVDSSRIGDENGREVLRAFIYDTKTQTVSVVDKQYLVPLGEFLPYFVTVIVHWIADDAVMQKFHTNLNYQQGMETSYQDVPLAVPPILFCMESVSPFGVKNLMKERPTSLVLHPVSHSWFHEPKMFLFSLSRMLRTQALWNGVIIVEAGNIKESVLYSSAGKVFDYSVLVEGKKWKLKKFSSE